jgi:hypothetical protein
MRIAVVAQERRERSSSMTKDELAQLRSRVNALFGAGDDDPEITRLWMAQCQGLDFARAMSALNQYAVNNGGKKSRFITGRFMRFYEAEPEPRRVVLVDREKLAREAQLKEARRAEEWASIREERERDRRAVLTANPLEVGEIVDALVVWGAPRPPAQPEQWPHPWFLAVADILGDRVRAAPTEGGYYEQVRDDRGEWRDDPTRPLRPMPARDWWKTYGVPGLAARGILPAAVPA